MTELTLVIVVTELTVASLFTAVKVVTVTIIMVGKVVSAGIQFPENLLEVIATVIKVVTEVTEVRVVTVTVATVMKAVKLLSQ